MARRAIRLFRVILEDVRYRACERRSPGNVFSPLIINKSTIALSDAVVAEAQVPVSRCLQKRVIHHARLNSFAERYEGFDS